MDDPFRRQAVAFGNLCLASRSTAKRATFFEQFRSGSTVNRTVHPAPAQQRGVRSVDDRVHLLSGDVTFDNGEATLDGWRFHGFGKFPSSPPR